MLRLLVCLVVLSVPLTASASYVNLAAGVLALHSASVIVPTPSPTPAPKPGICENCNGKGKVGDGTIMLPCVPCGGTGRINGTMLGCTCGEDCRCSNPLACEQGICHTEASIEPVALALADDCQDGSCSVGSRSGACSSGSCRKSRGSCSTSGCSSSAGNCGSGNCGSQSSGYKFGQPVRNAGRLWGRVQPVRRAARIALFPLRALRGFGCRGCR